MFCIDTSFETQKNDAESSNRLIAFDPATLSFQELAPSKGPSIEQGLLVNEQLYVFRTDSAFEAFTEILRYNQQQNAWKALGKLELTISTIAIASSEELIFFLGVRDIKGFLGVYNTTTKQYTEYTTNVKWSRGLACVRNNKLYYFGGIHVDFPRWVSRNMYVLDLDILTK